MKKEVKLKKELSRVMRKPTFWFPTWSDTNQAVQLQKMARGLKFRISEVEELYIPCSENKGADQLRGPLFSHMQIVDFLLTQLKLLLSPTEEIKL